MKLVAKKVAQFCIDKYKTACPVYVEFGALRWLHVPAMAMSGSLTDMAMIPYLISGIEDVKTGMPHLEKLNSEQLKLLGIDFAPYVRG